MGHSRYFAGHRHEMSAFLPARYERVLEIGCGEGGFVASLSPGCERWGVEQHAISAEQARGRMHRILVGDFGAVQDELPDGYFDLVVCNDVIEHMPDHDAFLESLTHKMRDGAYLVASIPNMRYYYCLRELLLRKEWVYQDHGVMDRTHLRFFTERSIRRMLTDHAFEIDRFSGINRLRGLRRVLRAMFFVLLTFGYYRDILFPQFAFRAIFRRRAADAKS